MADARVLLAFAGLVSVALLFVRFGVRPALAPLCSVAAMVLWFSLWGCLGALRLGGWVFYMVAALAAGYLVWHYALHTKKPPALSFGFWFFVAAGLCAIALLWARQPMFTSWDEFSLWGPAGKLMKLYDELYTTAPAGWNTAWTASQKPAMMVMSYYVQFWGAGFAEWQTYLGSDLLQLACMAAVLAPFEKKQWQVALPVALTCLLTPFLFQHYGAVTKISPVYMDSLADLPLGLCFGAVLCCWYAGEKGKLSGMVPVCLALGLLTMVKETGFALALVAAVLVCCDWMLEKRSTRLPLKKKLAEGGARLGLSLGATLLPYYGWQAHLGTVPNPLATSGVGGKTDMPMLQMPIQFIKDAFSPKKSELFTHVTGSMVRIYFTVQNTMLGSGFVVTLGVWGLLALAMLVCKKAAHRRRCLVYGIVSTLGMVAWYLLVGMSYLYLFREEQAFALESFERYVYPYLIGWFLGAVMLLGMAAVQERARRRAAVGAGAVVVMAALLFARVGQLVPAGYTLWGMHAEEYNERRVFSAQVRQLCQRLDPDGKTFIVNSEDNGIGWFMYMHEMLPWQVDYSYGGVMETRTPQPDGTTLVETVTAKAWEEHLIETGCTTVYIVNASEEFMGRYGGLFADGMAAYTAGETSLYSVQVQGGRAVLHPVPA